MLSLPDSGLQLPDLVGLTQQLNLTLGSAALGALPAAAGGISKGLDIYLHVSLVSSVL